MNRRTRKAPPALPPNPPPRNPFLADSDYAIGHGESAQQDSSPVRGPTGPSEVLAPADLRYQPLGPGHFGAGVSSPYSDGRRVIWSNGRESIVKLDHATFDVLATYPIPGVGPTSVAEMNAAISDLDSLTGVGVVLDQDGRPVLGAPFGKLRIER
jgi:hypothetical protein